MAVSDRPQLVRASGSARVSQLEALPMAVRRRVLLPRSPTAIGSAVPAAGRSRSGGGRATTGKPAARTRDGYQRGQPAGGQWRSQPHAGHLRWNSRPHAGYREFKPATREQARYRPLDPACLERPQNFRSRRESPPHHLEAEHGPGRRRLVQAPPAVSPHHAREGTGACHPPARYHSPKRTSRYAVPYS